MVNIQRDLGKELSPEQYLRDWKNLDHRYGGTRLRLTSDALSSLENSETVHETICLNVSDHFVTGLSWSVYKDPRADLYIISGSLFHEEFADFVYGKELTTSLAELDSSRDKLNVFKEVISNMKKTFLGIS